MTNKKTYEGYLSRIDEYEDNGVVLLKKKIGKYIEKEYESKDKLAHKFEQDNFLGKKVRIIIEEIKK